LWLEPFGHGQLRGSCNVAGRSAIVVGGGIGGLSAAIALQQAGWSAEVIERAEQIQAVGAGLTLQPNAVLALRRLKCAYEIERVGAHLRFGGLRKADGSPLSTLSSADAKRIEQAVGAPAIGIHRATLYAALASHVDGLTLGTALTEYRELPDRVQVKTSDGHELEADLLVGADGINSRVRAALLEDRAPRYAGYYCWRGVASGDVGLPDGWAAEYWGDGLRFGGCAIDGDRTYWFAVATGPPGGATVDSAVGDRLLSLYSEFAPEVSRLLAATDPQVIIGADIADHNPVSQWSRGRVTLLGDAAHAMTPNLGQGACQAIEDALVLGDQLAKADVSQVAEALAEYQRIRLPRANKTVRTARQVGNVARLHSRMGVAVRDGMLRAMPAAMLRSQLIRAWRLPY
jgi:2-polyprenyl-6-methoxyphenol hydroxylase-like FAD-dependent oxidoreductase